ncbi:MAG TPA: hypothetical protein VGJ92_13905 [Methanocella sp.]|jgi:hypothetical protein
MGGAKLTLGKDVLDLSSSGLFDSYKIGGFLESTFSGMGLTGKFNVKSTKVLEHRNFVEHSIPGRYGTVFQDMGRPSMKIIVEGSVSEGGNLTKISSRFETPGKMELLHKLMENGEPLDFESDTAGLFNITKVIVEDVQVADADGGDSGHNYRLVLREWNETGTKTIKAPSLPGGSLFGKFAKQIAKDVAKAAMVGGVVLVVALPAWGIKKYMDDKKKKTLKVAFTSDKHTLSAEDEAALTIKVNDYKNEPAEDATITLSFTEGDGLLADETLKTTDADGGNTMTTAFMAGNSNTCKIKATATKGDAKGESEITIKVNYDLVIKLKTDKISTRVGDELKVAALVTAYNGTPIEGAEVILECKNKADGSVLTEADVAITPAKSTTDSDGKIPETTVKFLKATSSKYYIGATVTKDKFNMASRSVLIKVEDALAVTFDRIPLRLLPNGGDAGEIKVKVCDSSDKAVADASVVLTAAPSAGITLGATPVKTDASGITPAVKVTVSKEGTYTVHAKVTAAAATGLGQATIESRSLKVVLDIPAKMAINVLKDVKFAVTDNTGEAITGATVTLTVPEDKKDKFASDPATLTATDSGGSTTGKIKFTAIGSYPVTATAKKDGYKEGSAAKTILAENPTITLTLECPDPVATGNSGRSLRATVKDNSGHPVKATNLGEATIKATLPSGASGVTLTGGDSKPTVDGILNMGIKSTAPGTVKITVEAKSGTLIDEKSVDVRFAKVPILINAKAPGRIAIRKDHEIKVTVTENTGLPAKNVTVKLARAAGTPDTIKFPTDPEITLEPTGEDGTTTGKINASAAGKYKIKVSAELADVYDKVEQTVDVTGEVLQLRLKADMPGRVITGDEKEISFAVKDNTGKPVKDAEIALVVKKGDGSNVVFDPETMDNTDNEGRAFGKMTIAAAGTYVIHAIAKMEGYPDTTQKPTVIAAAKSMSVAVEAPTRLLAGAEEDMVFTVKDGSTEPVEGATIALALLLPSTTGLTFTPATPAATDSEGMSTVKVKADEAGSYNVKTAAAKDGYQEATQTVKITVEQKVLKLAVAAPAELTAGTEADAVATVTDNGDQPVDGVSISYTVVSGSPADITLPAAASTGGDGTAAGKVSATTAGSFTVKVTATKAGYKTAFQTVRMTARAAPAT